MWNVQNKADITICQDQFFAELDLGCLHKMGQKTKKRLLALLEKLHNRYCIERDQLLKHQHIILRYFVLVTEESLTEGMS